MKSQKLWFFLIVCASAVSFAADLSEPAEEKEPPKQHISGRPGILGFSLSNVLLGRLPMIANLKKYSEKARELSENPRLEYIDLNRLRVFNPHFVSWKFSKMEARAKILAQSEITSSSKFSQSDIDKLVPSDDPIHVVTFLDPNSIGGRRYFVVEGQGRILSLQRALEERLSSENAAIAVEVTVADLSRSACDKVMPYRRYYLNDDE